jgi:hypothetical protein
LKLWVAAPCSAKEDLEARRRRAEELALLLLILCAENAKATK